MVRFRGGRLPPAHATPPVPRHRGLALLLASLLLLGAACSSEEPETAPDQGSTPSSTPTAGGSKDPRATGSGPAVTGDVRVAGTVASNLRAPWGLAVLPDGSALVTERDTRRVLLLPAPGDGERSGEPTEVGVVDQAVPGVEAGLLGVAVSPSFDDDRTVLLYVSANEDNRVLRGRLEDGRLGGLTPVLTDIPRGPTHDGGRLTFGPDGFLYVSTGDAGVPERAQDPDSLGGKILRVTADGAPAPGNPDPDSPVWSRGHRNVQGLAWDDQGRMWASEFGQDRADELNLVEPGGNYGWPRLEGEHPQEQGVDASDFTAPVLTWPTGEASPSGLAWWRGSLWMASLRGNRLWQVTPGDLDASGSAADAEERASRRAHLVDDLGRLRTVAPGADGSLWVTTSNRDGRGEPAADDDRVLRIQPAD